MISRILFIESVNILKKVIKIPNHPKITATDSKLEPKSRCSSSCMYLFLNQLILLYLNHPILQ